MKHIIISDIHSNHKSLYQICNKYNPEIYKYIFLGDYCDYRQENPRENSDFISVITCVMNIVKNYKGIALCGNHDDKLGRWFKGNKVDVKEGLCETIYDIENCTNKCLLEEIKNFVWNLPLCWATNIDGIKWQFAHAYYPREEEIFARYTERTPKEWKHLREHCIYGVPRNPQNERVFWWETDKYLQRIPENTIKVAGHYHLISEGANFLILDNTPKIATYIIEDKRLEEW